MASPTLPSSFANEKDLKFIITLATSRGSFSGGYQTITMQGLRASVHIDFAGGNMMPRLDAQIYGVTASDMNAITTLVWTTDAVLPTLQPNTIAVFAVDGTIEYPVFYGNIVMAWGVYSGMPDVYLMIQAQGGYYLQVTPASRWTIPANTTIASVMQRLATEGGMSFENDGVTGTVVKGQTLWGSYIDQIRQMASTYRNQFWWYFDCSGGSSSSIGTLAIVPPNTARPGPAPIISRDTGLMNYPQFYGYGVGVQFSTLFNPGIRFGGAVQIQSSIPKANGLRYVVSVSYDLESVTPGGSWQANVNTVWTKGQAVITSPGIA